MHTCGNHCDSNSLEPVANNSVPTIANPQGIPHAEHLLNDSTNTLMRETQQCKTKTQWQAFQAKLSQDTAPGAPSLTERLASTGTRLAAVVPHRCGLTNPMHACHTSTCS